MPPCVRSKSESHADSKPSPLKRRPRVPHPAPPLPPPPKTNKGNSSGKLGPFVTAVEQEFPAGEPGVYYNVSRLGPLEARLRGACVASGARVNLEFRDVALKVFGVQLAKKEWAPGAMRGHWAAKYWDEDFRAFTTNKGSLFVMERVSPPVAAP